MILKKVDKRQFRIRRLHTKVFDNCCVMPIINPLHGEKTGRSKILKNTIKLSDNSQLINLRINLNIYDAVLED